MKSKFVKYVCVGFFVATSAYAGTKLETTWTECGESLEGVVFGNIGKPESKFFTNGNLFIVNGGKSTYSSEIGTVTIKGDGSCSLNADLKPKMQIASEISNLAKSYKKNPSLINKNINGLNKIVNKCGSVPELSDSVAELKTILPLDEESASSGSHGKTSPSGHK